MTDPTPLHSSDFSQRLVSQETLPTERKSELFQELNTMFEKKLTMPRRIAFFLVTVIALVSSAVCGFLAITEPDLPTLSRTGISIGALFGLAWAGVTLRILKEGTLDLRRDNPLMAKMAWTFTVFMVVFFLYGGMIIEDRILGIMLIGQSLAFLIGAAVIWLTSRIEQSELATQEKLLQIELLVTELLEKR